jgi:RNA polymerase sigma-70 factor (ECF subfamily)
VSSGEVGAEVIDRCRRGDRDAFRALYEAYKDRVYSIAVHFLKGDRTTAHDVTQQVFVKLMTSIGQFRADAEFTTWLYRLVVNACIDAQRRSRSRLHTSDDQVVGRLTSTQSADGRLLADDTTRSVHKALAKLPAIYRATILLRYFDGLSYDDMARALNCTRGTVASRLNRAHRLLARALRSFGPQPERRP